MTDYQPIATPCIGVCRIGDNGLCDGCFRDVDEISYWRMYSEEEREQAWQRIEQRRQQAGVKPARS